MLMSNFSVIIRSGYIYASRELRHIDISGAEHPILMFLAKNPSTNQEAIAKYLMIDKGAIAKSLAKLEEKDFVIRTINKNNKRENIISLTEKGKANIEAMKKVLDEYYILLFKNLSVDEKNTFELLVGKIAKNVSEFIH